MQRSLSQYHLGALSLLLFVAAAGCKHVAPQTEALKTVHERYNEEFLRFTLPAPAPNPAPAAAQAGASAFAGTLQEIQHFRTTFGTDPPQAAHLDVLEGMIFLQTGQIGQAHLVAGNVERAQDRLQSGTGDFIRDRLFARSFGDLLKGWQEIHKKFDERDDTFSRFEPLREAADGLARDLESLDPAGMARPEVDQGALYLATTAAIFYVWAFSLEAEATETSEELAAVEQTRAAWFDKGRALIGRFLTEQEQEDARQGRFTQAPPGRQRYLAWYGFLASGAQGTP